MKMVSERYCQQVLWCLFFYLVSFTSQAQSCLSNPLTSVGMQVTNVEHPDLSLNISGILLNGAQLSVTVTIFNLHHSVGAPSGVPIAFYDGDPTIVNPIFIAQYVVPSPVAAGQTFQYTTQLDLSFLPVMPFYLYAVIGDDGTTSKPYVLDDFGSGPSSSAECFFLNNTTRFTSFIPLPIELLNFTVNALSENDFEFHWQTATEHDNLGFYLELGKAAVGQHGFESVAFLRGQGSTMSSTLYRHELRDLQPGQYYARLRQVDFSGASNYSDILSFKVEGTTPWVYPTVLRGDGVVNIFFSSSGKWFARLYDSNGALQQTMEIVLNESGGKLISMPINLLSPGFYYLIIKESDAGGQWTEKLVVLQN